MSSTPVLSFIKDITAKNTKAVQERLKSTPAQSSNQSFADPKEQGLSYSLLHKAVEVGSLEIISALLAAGADVNAPDTRGRTPLHWLASSTDAGAVNTAGKL
jgi:ankyrin repeat protein